MSQMQNIWHFYAAFIVMSMGVGLGTWMPMMTVLNNWFSRNRSTAMALAMEGFLVGGMILVPLLAFAIDPDAVGRPGWRNTALASACSWWSWLSRSPDLFVTPLSPTGCFRMATQPPGPAAPLRRTLTA